MRRFILKLYTVFVYTLIFSMLSTPLAPARPALAADPARLPAESGILATETPTAPGLQADMVDTHLIDQDSDGRVETGDTLQYTAVVQNTGSEATGVVFSDTLSSYLSLVPGSLETSVIAYTQTLTTNEDTALPLTLTFSNPDGDPLTYSILTPPANGSLSGTAPNLTYTPSSNYFGSDNFTFQICDNASPAYCDSATISLTVNPVNDAPSFNKGSDVTVLEDSGAYTQAGWATNLLPGPANETSQTLAFTITNNTNPGLFSAGPAVAPNGELTFTPAANANGSAVITLTLKDNGGTANGGVDTSPTQTFNITVTAVNDAPGFTKGSDVTVLEDSSAYSQPGWASGISAGPADESGQTLAFTITNNTNPGLFSAGPAVSSTGALTFTPAANANGSAVITLALKDNGGTANGGLDTSATQTFVINITAVNDAPGFTKGSDVQVAEDSGAYSQPWAAGISAGPANESGQTLIFTVTNNTNPLIFSVAPSVASNGVLSFTPAPDAEGVAVITLHLKDNGGVANGGVDISASQTFTITILGVNDAPVISPATFSLAENSANSTVVGTVSANPVEPGQTLVYAITAGNTNGAFAINPTTGQITVANSAALDFETNPTFNLTVQVTDNGAPNLSSSATITVNLTNVNEAPTVTPATFSLPENSANATVVGVVSASDPDAGQSLSYAITGGNTGGAFAINPTTGQITVANSAALNFETTPVFTLTVQVTDNGSPNLSHSAQVIVNLSDANDAPTVTPATFSLDEHSPNGTNVGTVSASDQDLPAQTLTFAITGGNTDSAFTINPSSGQITVANSSALDYGVTPVFTLTVQATDNGIPNLSGSAQVIVNLNSLNDYPVINPQTFSVDENSANSTVVGTVIASDPDLPPQTLTFAITGGNTGGAFAINPATGQITVANIAALDYETNPAFSLTVQVTDDGAPNRSSSATITINLNNVNEAPSVTPTTFSLPENSANSTVVGTVSASDPEMPPQTLTFAITGGNTGGAFAINPATGEITVANSAILDYEANPTFSLTVQATDNGSPNLNGSATITINLTNVNEAPVVTPATFSLPENSANATVVGTVNFSDPDSGQSHTFAITGGNTGGAFAINPTTGQITVANSAALDFETNPTFSLTVQVTDNGSPNLNASATITINLSNVNEAPVANNATFNVDENSPNGTNVGTVSASDPEAPPQTLTFSITGGNPGSVFAINPSTGQITVNGPINYEALSPKYFTLTVTVQDSGAPQLSDTATITVNINDINDAPTVTGESYETIGNTLLQVAAAPTAPAPRVFVTGNLLSNDTDEDGHSLSASILDATFGANVTLNATGTFTYLPPAGATSVVTFTYQVSDGFGGLTTGLVQITPIGMVWYVNNTVAGPGTGRSSDPFKALASAGSASTTNQIIYIFFGDGTTGSQDQGIVLKNGQSLIGAGVALDVPVSVNGGPNPTNLLSAGSQPLITASFAGNGVTIADVTGVIVKGLNIAGNTNAIDVTTSGATGGSVTIQYNTIQNTNNEGVDINQGSSGTLSLTFSNNTYGAGVTGNGFDARTTSGAITLAFSNNSLLSTAAGAFIDASGGGSITITAFADNTVSGNTGGSGITVTSATFDGTPGGTFQTVGGGNTFIGASGNGVGVNGLALNNVSGDLSFTDLDVFADNGIGLFASSLTAYTGSAGFQLAVSAGVSVIQSAGGPAVSLNTVTANLQLSMLTVSSSPTTGVSLVSVNGTFSAPSGSTIANVAGTDFNIDGGSANVTYAGPINNTAGRSISVTNRTGTNTVAFSGGISDTGQGILINANSSGTTVNFSGALTLNTGANAAFTATSGGTVSASDTTSTIATTTGTALNVSNVTIGAGGLNFRSIAANGATNGIVLNTTGSSAGLTVSGTGSAGSGGTIQNTTGPAILLTSTSNLSLSYMNITGSQNHGIQGTDVTNLTLSNVNVTNSGNADNEDGLNFTRLLGSISFTSLTVQNSYERNVYINNNTGTISSFNITNSTFDSNLSLTSSQNFLLDLPIGSNAIITSMVVTGSTFSDSYSKGFSASVQGSSQVNYLKLQSNTFTANYIGVDLSANATAVLKFLVLNNTLNYTGYTVPGGSATQVNVVGFSTSALEGYINNNIITTDPTGGGHGIAAGFEGNGSLKVGITGNTVNNFADRGILVFSTGGTGRVDATVNNNTVNTPSNPNALALFFFDVNTTTSTTNTLCFQMTNNTGNAGVSTTTRRARLRNFNTGTGPAVLVQGLAPSPGNQNDVVNYINTNNPSLIGSGAATPVVVSTDTDYTNSSCQMPSFPPSMVSDPKSNTSQLNPAFADLPVNPASNNAAASAPLSNLTGETIQLNIGTLPAGKTMTITFAAQIGAPLPANVLQVSNQARISGDNFAPVLTNDPDTAAPNDPTVTLLYRTPLAFNDPGYNMAEDNNPYNVAAPGVLGNDITSIGYPQKALLAIPPAVGSLTLNQDGSFSYTAPANYNGAVTFTYVVSDTVEYSSPAVATITITPVNDAPLIDNSGDMFLNAIPRDQFNNPGTAVAAIIASAGSDRITDVDAGALEGIAVTAVDDTNGEWQFSTDGGVNWTPFGSPSVGSARLLAASAVVRFVPDPAFTGDIDPGITFFAWDQTSGSNGATANASTRGGTTAFSAAAETARITVLDEANLSIQKSASSSGVLAGNQLTYTLVVTNAGPNIAGAATLTDTLPFGVTLFSAPGYCTLNGSQVVCSLGDLAVGQVVSLEIVVDVQASTVGQVINTATVGSSVGDPFTSDNTASAITMVYNTLLVYDLQDNPGAEWTNPILTTSPCGITFLGELGNETNTLTLNSLPPHTQVMVTFDLYILRSWNGNVEDWTLISDEPLNPPETVNMVGPDRWQLVADGQTLLATTFSNHPLMNQAFPGSYPGGDYPFQTGAASVGQLCYNYYNLPMSSVYHMIFIFDHTRDGLALDFTALGLQGLENESWGLDNVQVFVSAGGIFTPYKVYSPLVRQ